MKLSLFQEIIDDSHQIVFFGGAGVSTESGIPDFRSGSGLYSKKKDAYSPEEILHHSFFIHNTEAFYAFYFSNMVHIDAQPNNAHTVLAQLESCGKLAAIVTQNIDGLHQQAGSKTVFELHGSIMRNHCIGCGQGYSLHHMLRQKPSVPFCEVCGEVIKPDVVLYGERLDDTVVANAIEYISHADTLIIGGTSLSVYPAAGLVQYFRGNHLVLINKTETAYDHKATLILRDSIGQAFASLPGYKKAY